MINENTIQHLDVSENTTLARLRGAFLTGTVHRLDLLKFFQNSKSYSIGLSTHTKEPPALSQPYSKNPLSGISLRDLVNNVRTAIGNHNGYIYIPNLREKQTTPS